MLPYADRVTKVSIIPRGLGALGYTLQLPIEDRYLLTRSELRDRMAGLMGGRVAEEEVFGEPSTGASNDLQQASGLARMMVRDYGMSHALGPVSLGDQGGPSFLGIKGMEQRVYSEQTALEVDREVQSMVVEAQERARELVRRHRDRLDAMAARLLTTEVIEEEEITRLWGPKASRPGMEGPGHTESPPENPNRPVAVSERRAFVIPQTRTAVHDGGDHDE
jgi:cell division protease FtsH